MSLSQKQADAILQAQIEQKQRQIAEKLKESIRMMNDTKDIANDINVNLDAQSKKLEKIDDTLDDTTQQLKKAKKTVTSIGSFFGSIKNAISGMFQKKPAPQEKLAKPVYQQREITPTSTASGTSYVSSVKVPAQIGDQHLDELMAVTKDLIHTMKNTNQELDYQTKLISRVTDKTDKNTAQMNQIHKKMRRIIQN